MKNEYYISLVMDSARVRRAENVNKGCNVHAVPTLANDVLMHLAVALLPHTCSMYVYVITARCHGRRCDQGAISFIKYV